MRQTRAARLARDSAAQRAGFVKAAKTKAAKTAAMTPKQKAAQHMARSASAKKGAATRAKDLAAFQKVHGVGSKPPNKARQLGHAPLDDKWILGDNDVADSCVAVALANSFLISTGLRPCDEELMAWCKICQDISIQAGLQMLMALGLSGIRPTHFELTEPYRRPGLVMGLVIPHAVTVGCEGLISWGDEIPVSDEFISEQVVETWLIEWPQLVRS